jgi:NAD dependent epimerase/dehydratase family enzyme
MSTVVLDGQRVAPERLLALGYKFAFPEVRPALENLLIS